MPRRIYRVATWFESRLGLRQTLGPLLRHPVPRGLGWWYVFGSATLTLFLVQVVTGTVLALVYVPSAANAHASLEYLNYGLFWGWWLRAIHYWSASGMVVMLILHMTRVFLSGAFKYPRQLTWIVGVFLLVFTLGLAFTGQVLRWDTDAYWGLGVGASMIGRLPVIGPGLVRLILGGPILGGDTLSRFFTLHVFWLPGLLILFLTVHLYLVVKQGISALPVAGQPDQPEAYQADYARKLAAGEPFFPYDFSKDAIVSCLTVLVVVLVAFLVGPKGPSGIPDPTQIHTEPRPDWEFMSFFAVLALSPPRIETIIMLGLPPLLFVILFLVPFLADKGERAPSRRPVAVLSTVLIFLTFGVLTGLGYKAPWSPKMTAWSSDTVPEHLIGSYTPRQLQGATVFQYKSCRNCHSLDGIGGQRGPDLTAVATRLAHDELIRQVIQGGGNMPAYGDELQPAEVEVLVSFLETLRPKGEKPARSSIRLHP